MSGRIQGRGIAAALVLALTLATPAHAAALNGWEPASGLLLRVWHWLTGGWEAPVGRQGRAGGPTTTKEGPGIDPMGASNLRSGSTPSSTVPNGGGTVSSSGG
jgi:hypothetical protein